MLVAAATMGRAGTSVAQEPAPAPPPEPSWKGGIGAGLAITAGNSDTNSYNVSLGVAYDPKRKNSLKAEGLYLRSTTADVRSVDKTALGVRDERKLSGRSYAFAETRYFRDVLKEIRYLVSPLVGLGVKIVARERAQLSVDGAVGGQFEKDTGRPRTSSGALQAGEQLAFKLSPNASLTQRSAALWKMNDFGDALYRFEIGVAASLARRFELKLAFLDDYKTRPANPLLKKNDASVVAALVFKIG